MKMKHIFMITALMFFAGCKTTEPYIFYNCSSDFQPSHNTKFLLIPSSNLTNALKKYSTFGEALKAGDPTATKKSPKDLEIEAYIMAALMSRGWLPLHSQTTDSELEMAFNSGNLLYIVWDFEQHFHNTEKQVFSPVYGQNGSNTYTSGTVNATSFGANYNQNTYSIPTYGITGYDSNSVKEIKSYHKLQIAAQRVPDNGSFELTVVRWNEPNVGYLRSVATMMSSCYDLIGDRTSGESIEISADPYSQDTENFIMRGELVYNEMKQ